MVLSEVLRQQAKESEEDFFDALGEAVFADAVLLDGGEAGIDRKEVDKAFAELKKEGAIVSPVRCKWQPA